MNLPLNGRRWTDLLLLSDNITTEPKGTRGAALSNTGPTVAVAGQRGGHNMYFLDGVSITDQYFNNLGVSLSIDAIQEFNVQKAIYPAEYGGKASAMDQRGNEVRKQCVPRFGLRVLPQLRVGRAQLLNGATKPPLRLNQFGGTLGGAIKRDKTFFFFAGESLRERRSQTGTFSLPPSAIRGGDFSSLAAIYDPLTTNPTTGQRTAFAGNVIPVTRLDPIAVAFLQKVPVPNAAGNVQNYTATPVLTNNNKQFTGRLDHHFGPNDTMLARYTYADSDTFRPFGSSDLNETLVPGFGTTISTYTRNLALSHTHIFSPTVIHDFRFGFLRVTGGQRLQNQGTNFAAANGLLGVSTDAPKLGYPAINFSGAYSAMGDPARVVGRENDSFDVFSTTTVVRGAHTVKFGGYYFRLHFNPSDAPNARGNFTFSPRFSSSAAGLSNGNAFADFLLGAPSAAQSGIGRGLEHGRTNSIHSFIQDDWRARKNLDVQRRPALRI